MSAAEILSICAWASAWTWLTNASETAFVSAWAAAGVEPVPVMVRVPVTGSTTPVTWLDSAWG